MVTLLSAPALAQIALVNVLPLHVYVVLPVRVRSVADYADFGVQRRFVLAPEQAHIPVLSLSFVPGASNRVPLLYVYLLTAEHAALPSSWHHSSSQICFQNRAQWYGLHLSSSSVPLPPQNSGRYDTVADSDALTRNKRPSRSRVLPSTLGVGSGTVQQSGLHYE